MHLPLTMIQVQVFATACLIGAAAPAPRNYAAPRAPAPIKIDGDIYKKAWAEVPWSHDFVEIRGADAPATSKPTPGTRTRVKMRWDDDFLYIAAEMTAKDFPITAEFTKRNEPIYQKDSDIEVFLDTDGSNSNYKELEVNARNTVWNLMLNRPYSSQGVEHSARVAKPGEEKYWEVKGQKTAAKMYGAVGKLQPNGKWTAEMALSHKDSLDRTKGPAPAVGKFWRINFSRVEKKGDINWVWSPQMIWTPGKGDYVGQVNMHAPDAWGYIVFVEAGQSAGPQQDWIDPGWDMKTAAHQIFYAEKFASQPEGGGKLLSISELQKKNWVSANSFQGLETEVTSKAGGDWTVRLEDATGCVSTIQQDNLFAYECPSKLFGLISGPHRYMMIGLGSLVLIVMLGTGWAIHKKIKPGASRE